MRKLDTERESALQATRHYWQRWNQNLRFWTLKGNGACTLRRNPTLTLAGAETEPAVRVVVGCGAAPRRAIGAAVGGAGQVGAALKGEGEVTGRTICVSKVGWNHCGKKGTKVKAAERGIGGEENGGRKEWGHRGGLESHRRPCPGSTTLRRRNGRLPECRGQEEKRVPEARPSRRRDTHLRALKKQVARKGVNRALLRSLRAIQGRASERKLKSPLRAALPAVHPGAVPLSPRRGRIRTNSSQGCRGRHRKAGSLRLLHSPGPMSRSRSSHQRHQTG